MIKPIIAIVEDDPTNAIAYKTYLKDISATVTIHKSGDDFLMRFKDEKSKSYALIILDIEMGGLNGFQTAEKIYEEKGATEIPIIFMTAKSDKQGIEKIVYKMGATGFIAKPIDPDVFRARANYFLESYLQKEALKEALAKEQELSRLKTEFLNIISHELRTPLTVILGNITFLKDHTCLPPAEEIADIAIDVETNSNRLLTVLNEIILYSKLEAGLIKPNFEDSSILEAIQSDLDWLENQDTKNGRLSFKIDVENCDLTLDPKLFSKAIRHLIDNAYKFTKEGEVRVRGIKQKKQYVLFIEDTGIGINEKQISRIFEPFSVADNSSTRIADGIGMGLPATKKICDFHNAKLTLDSVLGEGSSFRIELQL